MMLDENKLIEAAARAFCGSMGDSSPEWESYAPHIEVALKAFVDNLPDPFIEADKEAERLNKECIAKNPGAETVPSIFHWQQKTRPNVDFYKLWLQLKSLGK